MKKMYFLTSIFENKFGKAKKYYDGDSWHWMLNTDKPEMYSSIEEANKKAHALIHEDLIDLSIKEVNVYENVWEHKIPKEDIQRFLSLNGQPTEVVFYQEQKKHYLFLSMKKQIESPVLIEGLYCVDRKADVWIYCMNRERNKKINSKENFGDLLVKSYYMLKKAEELMILWGESSIELRKVEDMLIIMQDLLPDDSFCEGSKESIEEVDPSPIKWIQKSFLVMKEAKTNMQKHQYDLSELEQIEQLLVFYERLL